MKSDQRWIHIPPVGSELRTQVEAWMSAYRDDRYQSYVRDWKEMDTIVRNREILAILPVSGVLALLFHVTNGPFELKVIFSALFLATVAFFVYLRRRLTALQDSTNLALAMSEEEMRIESSAVAAPSTHIHADNGSVIALGDISNSQITLNTEAGINAVSAIRSYLLSEASTDAQHLFDEFVEEAKGEAEKSRLRMLWDQIVQLAPGVTHLSKAVREIVSWFS